MECRTRHELRCTCSGATLLAFYGMSTSGQLYLHQKSYRQNRVYSESVVEGRGVVRICCRSCRRWTRIRMNPSGVSQQHSGQPKVLREPVAREWLSPESPGK